MAWGGLRSMGWTTIGAGLALQLACAGQTPASKAPGFETLLKEGFALHQASRYAEAIPVLEQARRIQPQDYFANLLLGIDLLRSGKPAEAVPRLRVAAKVKPEEEIPADYLGEAEEALGEHALAAQAYLQGLVRGHDSEQSLEAWAGFALERFRAIGEALRSSQQGVAVASRLQSTNEIAEAGRECPERIPGLEQSLAAKRAGSELSLHGDAAYRLSVCYAVEAGRAAERLKNGAEDMAAVYRLRGDVLLRLKADGAGAEAAYRQAIAIRNHDPALLERLAEAQLAAGEMEGATESARRALAMDPHRPGALRTLAATAMNNHQYAEAIPTLRQLVAEAPGDRGAAVELARALAQTGETDEAFKLLAAALASGYLDEKGASHALLARLLRKSGHTAEAARAEAEARRLSDAYQARDHSAEAPQASGEKLPDAVH